jgi:hypothetical protein
MTLFRTTGLLAALALLGFISWLNYDQLHEAYGSGPPFFSRTTNMDKWASPLPSLIILDGIGLLIAAAGVQMFRRRQAERAAVEAIMQD